MTLRSARRGSGIFVIFVLFTIGLLSYRSRLLIGLLFEDGGADALYPADIPSPDFNVSSTQLIPKIIHQTYKNESIPERWQAGQQAVKDLHPDWTYMFWTDDSALEFVQTHYPSHLSTYISYPHPIQRVDALRYFLLHHYGGIYLDLDIAPFRPLDPLLQYPAFACRTIPTGISNDALGSIAGHNFWVHVTGNLEVYNRNWLLSYITVMYSTGPLFLSVMWVEYLSKLRAKTPYERNEMDRFSVLIRTEVEGDSYGFFDNVEGGSWHGRDTEMIFWMGRHWVIVTLLGFFVSFGVAGVSWWVLRRLVGVWSRRKKRWWEKERLGEQVGYELREVL